MSNDEHEHSAGIKRGIWSWLTNSQPRRLLLPITGAWILGLDWLLFSQTIMSAGLGMPFSVVAGFFLGGAGAYYFQRRKAGDRWGTAVIKALAAGIAVGIPWPIVGTGVGGWVLLASGLTDRRRGATDRLSSGPSRPGLRAPDPNDKK